jgi:predicted ATPase
VANQVSISSVKFKGYKGLKDFSVRLSHMNILVGPNNSGKSTVLGAFRMLAQALRRARTRRASMIRGPSGMRAGWRLGDDALPISVENIHTNYADIDTIVEFRVSNRGTLTLFFPDSGGIFFLR